MTRDEARIANVPPPDFVGAMCEIWFPVNYAAYHLAYTRVYCKHPLCKLTLTTCDWMSRPSTTKVKLTRLSAGAASRRFSGSCTTCLKKEIAIKRGQKEHSTHRYFYTQERELE
jgi:hypothetical protein